MKLTVVGAGPAGLACSIEARRRGMDVVVLEQAPAFGPVGSGVVLHSNGLRVLDALGIALPEVCFARKLALHEESGEKLAEIDYADLDRPRNSAAVLLRPVLMDLLLRAALEAGVEIRFGQRCERAPEGTVVAADGVRSAVRTAAGIRTRFRETGEAYVRGISTHPSDPHSFREIWGRDGRQFGICPLPGGRTFFFCTAPFRRWPPPDREAWIESWRPLGPEVVSILRGTDWPASNYDEVKEVEVARWSAPSLHLIGDAAHAMTPNLGQGANAALVDGLVLARLLAEGQGAKFEAIRRPFVSKVQRVARRMSQVSRWSWGPARALRDLIVRWRGSAASALRMAAGVNPPEEPYLR